jgi:hypothetical protein
MTYELRNEQIRINLRRLMELEEEQDGIEQELSEVGVLVQSVASEQVLVENAGGIITIDKDNLNGEQDEEEDEDDG